MRRFSKYWVRGLGVWLLLIAVTALFADEYTPFVGMAGAALLMGSYLVFSVLRVKRMLKHEPLSGMNEAVPADSGMRIRACLTGNTNRVSNLGRSGRNVAYTEYEMTYEVEGRQYKKWFSLYPGPDLEAEELTACEVWIVCDINNPDHFEVQEII